ncbi:MAG: DUF4199 domain-containing protein [Bacteroidia bacterium]
MDIKKMQPLMIKWGLIKGVITILVGLLSLQFIGNPAMSLLPSLLLLAAPILILLFAFKEYKNINEGFMRLKEAIVLGLGIYLVEYLISTAWTLLYNNVINPGGQDEALDKAMDQMEASPGMSDGMLDMFSGIMETAQSPMAIIFGGLVSAFFFGAIWSLIMGAILKKDPNQG